MSPTHRADHGKFETLPDFSAALFMRAAGGRTSDAAEVALADSAVGLRRSGDPNGPVLAFTRAEWRAFTEGVIAGELAMASPRKDR